MESDIAVPLGVVMANATDSGPDSAASLRISPATVSSASSHEIRIHPGSGSPLGRVRFIGWRMRSGLSTCSGAACPFAQSARPVGWDGSRSIPMSRPSRTTEMQPHRDRHSAHQPGMRVSCTSASATVASQSPGRRTRSFLIPATRLRAHEIRESVREYAGICVQSFLPESPQSESEVD